MRCLCRGPLLTLVDLRLCPPSQIANSPLLMVRGKGRIRCHPAMIYELLSDPRNKKKWNSQFNQMDIIEEVDERLRVSFCSMRGFCLALNFDLCIKLMSFSFPRFPKDYAG